MNAVTIISLFGGLGMFLYGMKLMSKSIERAAGAKMRSFLDIITKNQFIGMLFGIIFTAIIQSSNATTVMIVSFVNSGLMNLYQSAGVILGANIGTTVTSQLIAFNLSDIAPLFIIIGVIIPMIAKNETVKKIGDVILGFGILFVGLSNMSAAMKAMREAPVLVNFLTSLDNHFLALFVGFLMTAILQSSSATVGIVLLLASQGLIEVSMTYYMIMGCNIGCTMSAMFAGSSGNKDAKRAALIHFLFNVIGTVILFIVISIFQEPITAKLLAISGGDAGRAVANAHMSIKIIEVIMLFPFMKKIVDLTFRIVPEGTEETAEEGHHFETLFIHPKNNRTTFVYDVICEINRMGQMAIDNLEASMNLLLHPDMEKIDAILDKEKYIDYLNHTITNFLVAANRSNLPLGDAERLGGLFHVVNDIERVGDHAENFAESARSRAELGIEFSEKGEKQLTEMTEKVIQILQYALEMFVYKNEEHMQEILTLEEEIDTMEKKFQNSHIKRLTKGKCTPEAGMMFSDTLSGLERVGDHATNIAFSILDPTGDVDWKEEED